MDFKCRGMFWVGGQSWKLRSTLVPTLIPTNVGWAFGAEGCFVCTPHPEPILGAHQSPVPLHGTEMHYNAKMTPF